jgi:excisionase family DNA binding protein
VARPPTSSPDNNHRPAAYGARAFAADYGLSKSRVYELIYAGELRAVRAGRRILIPREAADEWLASLPEAV